MPGSGIPDFDGIVFAAADDPVTVGAKRHALDEVGVSLEG